MVKIWSQNQKFEIKLEKYTDPYKKNNKFVLFNNYLII